MKKTLILLAFLAAACTAPVRETLVSDPADYVSTLVGTQSDSPSPRAIPIRPSPSPGA